MSQKLQAGQVIKSYLGLDITVIRHLGEGGQGDVYEVSYDDQPHALKWYKKNKTGAHPELFYDNLKKNVMAGSPSPNFLWPIDLSEYDEEGFGYVMGLRPQGYYEITDFILRKVTFSSFKTAVDASLNIVSAFRLLHNHGYSYQDLNDGNFFVSPKDGKVLICDNDNVAPNGVQTGILGKPRYMAPEIVLQKNMPDKLSDRFSMSVILFILFCLNHPLEGKRSLVASLTPELQEKLYGSEALFIMDETDDANAPSDKIHKNVLKVWPHLPDYMKAIFEQSFNQEGIHEPAKRPTEAEWVKALVRFRSDIIRCSCKNEIFFKEGEKLVCEKCHQDVTPNLILDLDEYRIPAIKGTRIYRCQTEFTNADAALDPVGLIVANKQDPKKIGIRNLTEDSWAATTPSGKQKAVKPGEIIPLREGISFKAGSKEIKITKNGSQTCQK